MNEISNDSRSLQVHIVIATGLGLIGCLWAAWRDGGIGLRLLYVALALGATGVEFLTKRRWGTLSMIAADIFLLVIAIFANIGFRWYETLGVIFWSAATMYVVYAIKQSILASAERLKREYNRYISAVMVDPVTELKTQRAYLGEASIYLRLARRNSLEVALFLWELPDEEAIRDKIGEHSFNMLTKKLSVLLRNHIRYEDLLYIMETQPHTWGMLMITKKEFISVVAKRQAARLKQIMVPGLDEDWTNGMRVRVSIYDGGEDISPLTLYNRACKADVLVLE